MPKTTVRTIAHIRRLKSSVNGNPRFMIDFEDAPAAVTMSDAGFCYAIGNPGMRVGSKVVVELTYAGRIRHMEPAS
jgi:hypothetical protein